MQTATAQIPTDRAGRYMSQLCKHFAHKIPVTLTETEGSIAFSFGICRLHAADDVLTLNTEAGDATQLAQLQDVVARHLERFAFAAPVAITWQAT